MANRRLLHNHADSDFLKSCGGSGAPLALSKDASLYACFVPKENQRRLRYSVILFIILMLIFLNCCAPSIKMREVPVGQTKDLEKRAASADAFFRKGCYLDFKRAIQIYQELYNQPSIRNQIIIPYVKALILMTVRERELGILNDSNIQTASNIMRGNPDLQFFAPYIELVNCMYPKTKGIMKDIDTVGTWQIVSRLLKDDRLNADMRLRAQLDDYFAYLYVTFYLEFGKYLGQKEVLSDFTKQYPDSVLLKYKNAITPPKESRDLLEGLLRAEPDFYEAYYFLGELALGIDKPVEMDQGSSSGPFEAEKNFLRASEAIPESPQITIYLGGIYALTEEYDKGIEYFDKTIALAPTYRDALLGKSICLSYMGKHEEAIEILDKLRALGTYLMGESHYWLAWNYHELKDLEKAQLNIDESRARLPADSEVLGLAGTIALEKNELDRAEKEFESSLEANGKNLKSILGLSRVLALKQRWLDSAQLYSHSATAAAQQETVLADKIRTIENSTLAPERKTRIIIGKRRQIGVLEETGAMACYEAAVGYLHAGRKELALDLAAKAAAHPQFKRAAEQLIRRIK